MIYPIKLRTFRVQHVAILTKFEKDSALQSKDQRCWCATIMTVEGQTINTRTLLPPSSYIQNLLFYTYNIFQVNKRWNCQLWRSPKSIISVKSYYVLCDSSTSNLLYIFCLDTLLKAYIMPAYIRHSGFVHFCPNLIGSFYFGCIEEILKLVF